MAKEPENIEDLDMSALDEGDEPEAPEIEDEPEEEDEPSEADVAEAATGDDDEPQGDDSGAPKDEIFEALVASGKLKEAEKYVALQEQQRAAQAKPEAEPEAALSDDDLGFGEEAEQGLNAVAYKQQLINTQRQFQANQMTQLYSKGQKLRGRYDQAVTRSAKELAEYNGHNWESLGPKEREPFMKLGADSEEARDLLADYDEVRASHTQAHQINEAASEAIRRLDGVERIVAAVPALKRHHGHLVKLVDQGVLDPFAPSDEVKKVLREHLPKAAAKPGANGKASPKPAGKNQPEPEDVRKLRHRLGSTRGNASGGASGGQDGDRRAKPGNNGSSRPKVSRETQAAYDRIAGRTRK